MAVKRSKHKSYPLDQSPLYKLKIRRKLAALFNMPLADLEGLANRCDNYRIFSIRKGTNRSREVEQPKPSLERVHRRLFTLLSSITSPTYLHSGVKGRSYITNAESHIGARKLVKLDIKKFFPSTKGWHIFEFFHKVMCCSSDVSGLLTKISTCNNHIPKGSCLSQIIAFYAHFRMFEEIHELALSSDLTFTCYVDDITISGKDATKRILYKVRGVLKKRRLTSHPVKEHVYQTGVPKEVTGTIVTGNGLLLPNRKHKDIHDEIITIFEQDNIEHRLELINTTVGKVIAASQVDPSFKRKALSLQNERNRIQKKITKG